MASCSTKVLHTFSFFHVQLRLPFRSNSSLQPVIAPDPIPGEETFTPSSKPFTPGKGRGA